MWFAKLFTRDRRIYLTISSKFAPHRTGRERHDPAAARLDPLLTLHCSPHHPHCDHCDSASTQPSPPDPTAGQRRPPGHAAQAQPRAHEDTRQARRAAQLSRSTSRVGGQPRGRHARSRGGRRDSGRSEGGQHGARRSAVAGGRVAPAARRLHRGRHARVRRHRQHPSIRNEIAWECWQWWQARAIRSAWLLGRRSRLGLSGASSERVWWQVERRARLRRPLDLARALAVAQEPSHQ